MWNGGLGRRVGGAGSLGTGLGASNLGVGFCVGNLRREGLNEAELSGNCFGLGDFGGEIASGKPPLLVIVLNQRQPRGYLV